MYTMILDGSYPQDIRVRKEAESMAAAGIALRIITRWKKGEQRHEVINGVEVYRIGRHYSHQVKGINDMVTALFFVDLLFYFGLKRFFKDHKASTLHVHDLALIKTVLLMRKDQKVILDMHENYPEMLEELRFSTKGFLKELKDRIFFSYKRWKKYEARWIRKPDHIIAVVDEMKEKLIREYGISHERITVVSNYEKLDFTAQSEPDDFIFEKDTFYLGYVGGISPVRGLETIIDAVKLLRDGGEKVAFVIVGGGNTAYVNSLKERAMHTGYPESFAFQGYRNFKKINYYISNVQINVIPHIKNEHTDHTIPHKLFQIMLQKAPLLVSSCKPMMRILGEHNAGFVFEADNVRSCADLIRYIADHPEEVKMKVENAFNLAQNEYNWDLDSQKLIELSKVYG